MAGAFTFRRPVRFDEIDAAGLMYFPRVIALAHEAIERILEASLAGGYARFVVAERIGLPCVHVSANFVGPLRFGDDVEVETRVGRFGATSVALDVEVRRGDGAPCAHISYVVACADLDGTPRKRAIPDDLRRVLEGHTTTG